jgi:hypothetical protein
MSLPPRRARAEHREHEDLRHNRDAITDDHVNDSLDERHSAALAHLAPSEGRSGNTSQIGSMSLSEEPRSEAGQRHARQTAASTSLEETAENGNDWRRERN